MIENQRIPEYYQYISDENITEYIDYDNFIRARDKAVSIVGQRRVQNPYDDGGVGVLKEKSVHSCLKYYIEPEDDFHEVAIDGFFADICKGSDIFEIQTAHFQKLRKKLPFFLENYNVTVVYPICVNQRNIYIDGNYSFEKSRISPYHSNEYFVFEQLYKIKDLLLEKNLNIHVYLIDAAEIKMRSDSPVSYGKRRYYKKKRSNFKKIDRVPIGLRDIIKLNQMKDYMRFVPPELDLSFTSLEFGKAAGIGRSFASLVLNILYHTGTVERVGKKGNYYLYETAY